MLTQKLTDLIEYLQSLSPGFAGTFGARSGKPNFCCLLGCFGRRLWLAPMIWLRWASGGWAGSMRCSMNLLIGGLLVSYTRVVSVMCRTGISCIGRARFG